MNILQSLILGVIEGLTEFLPVSSTFHLIFSSQILGLAQTDFTKLYEVFIQAGAILAVFFLYLSTYLHDRQLLKKTLVAFIPTAIVGFLMYKIIKNIFFASNTFMLTVFIIVGIIFIVYEYILKKNKTKESRSLQTFSYGEAVFVGFMQALAVMPGVSRAGAVILAMMFLKFRRDEAARFSFLLSVPTILAASGYDLFKMRKIAFAYGDHMLLLVVGFVAAFISAYFVVKWFISYLQKHSLSAFGWYRIVLGFLLVIFGPK
ncbi:MAG: undecaprenyl-diphosphate phosphatase [Candidatus Levyibacteriota bacterium]